MEAPMASIFHYTNAEGLKGILSSKTLFATDCRFLNDTGEVGVIRNLVLPVLETEIAEMIPKLVERQFVRWFYEFHGERGNRCQAGGFFEPLIKLMNNVSPLFVLSFCRHDERSKEFDPGLLSQWRGYGDEGGYAIEFDDAGVDNLSKTKQTIISHNYSQPEYQPYTQNT